MAKSYTIPQGPRSPGNLEGPMNHPGISSIPDYNPQIDGLATEDQLERDLVDRLNVQYGTAPTSGEVEHN